MSQIHAGWRAYHDGDYRKALEHFKASRQWPEMVSGLALAILSIGQGSDALLVVEQQAREHHHSDLDVLLGDLTGRTSKRADAERILQAAVNANPEHALARSLLGEQRIRQGRWDEGTQDFIAGLAGADPRATLHMRRVVLDLVDAVAARRIPQAEAMRFINRIDYSIPNKDAALNQFFGTARRAINAQQRLDDVPRTEPWSYGDSAASQAHPQRPAQQASPSLRDHTTSPQKSSTSRSRTASATLDLSSHDSATPDDAPPSPSPAQERRSQARERRQNIARERSNLMDAGLTNMSRVLREERNANEALQQSVPAAIPPAWPSEMEEPIDTIPPIALPSRSVLSRSDAIRSSSFRLTGGDIGVEITLERCMHNMLASIQSIGDITVPFTLQALRQLELNLLDDVFARMPELSALYRDETAVDDQRPLAVGKFLGDCLAQAFGAVWSYAQPPEASTMRVGQEEIDPLGVARTILDAEHFDAIGFEQLVRQSEKGTRTSTAMVARHFYVDPTPGLDGEALHMKLAELWVAYRFELSAIQTNEIAASLRTHMVHRDVIVFSVDKGFVPASFLRQIGPGALSSEGRTSLAYVRSSGEFLLLASARHFARFLETAPFELTSESLPTLLPWLQRLFRPGWRLVESDEIARQAVERTGVRAITAPTFARNEEIARVQVNFLERATPHVMRLHYNPDALVHFEIEIQPLS
ncbi:hypothetical protein EA187_18370 [Lujinxingia sediminis]|uniref:Tetratricopeptide repeat protein n=1 Tax=Lujinxingia sediminis TaxID=2480984 RepID=A0ABY0CNG2_9DELT|nr:hypothetical protein [Lujinxingia sediminis]RVU41512.1 hypothetical protein EA187_18370 [Lujinxingia sediminis]